MDCLNQAIKLIHDKGSFVCQSCFGKRYSKRKFNKIKATIEEEPTLENLKKKWER